MPNGDMNSLFDDISLLSIEERMKEVKVCFLKNDKTVPYSNVSIFTEQTLDCPFSIRIGAVSGSYAELLSSKNEIPYDVEFHRADVVFAFADLICEKEFVPQEIVIIEGQEIPVGDGKIETFLDNAIEEFEFNPTYSAVKQDDKTLRLKHREVGEFTNTPVVSTQNPGTITVSDFGGYVDNSLLLAETIEPEDSICLYIMRIFKKKIEKTDEQWNEEFERFRDNNFEPIENSETESANLFITYENYVE